MFGLYVSQLARHRMLASQCCLARQQLHSRSNSPPLRAKFLLVLDRPGSSSLLTQIPRNVFARPFSTQSPPKERSSVFSRVLPPALQSNPATGSSLRKVIALAKPEKKPLFFAICLLLVSSSVAMSVPFTIGKLIDYFSSENPVRRAVGTWSGLSPTAVLTFPLI